RIRPWLRGTVEFCPVPLHEVAPNAHRDSSAAPHECQGRQDSDRAAHDQYDRPKSPVENGALAPTETKQGDRANTDWHEDFRDKICNRCSAPRHVLACLGLSK